MTSTTTNTGTALTVGYTYSDDMLTAIQTGSTTYSFVYGDFALRSSTKIGSRTLASYSYSTDGNHYLTSLDYGNGDSVDYSYDKYGNVTKETYEDSETVSYAYDNNGDLATVTDSATGRKNTYYYDTTARLMKYTEKSDLHEFSMAYSYDELNRVSGVEEDNNGIHRSTVYTYDDSSRVTKSQTENTSRNYTYDGYGRVSQTTTKEGNIQIKSDAYSYSSGSTGTSGQISQHVVDTAGYDKTYNYTYDDNGNIVSISDGSSSITYEYDSANQLIRENNQEGGYTYTWTYNNAGNILNRKEYAYTSGTLGTATDTISYTYGDSAWGDLLTAYDGTTYSYDTIGNLTSDENYTYTWKYGRELQRISSGMQFWTMTYDANGMRTKRESNSMTYEYVYSGSLLSSMKSHNSSTGDRSWFYFIYDAGGLPMAEEYKGTLYYYVTNLQGDVIAIINSSGNQVVGYRYDAWGNVLTVSGSMSTTLGKENPLRYRGYVFDRETNLYYLESRYYNPETGRFLNADGYTATGQGFVGNNMYAYCLNNPVNLVDLCGYAAAGAFRANRRAEKKAKDFLNKVFYSMEEKAEKVIYNDDEKVVIEEQLPYYKGVPVVHFSSDLFTSFSIGGVIFLNENAGELTVKHEYGHSLQEKEMGTGLYIMAVAVPSVTYRVMEEFNEVLHDNYYNMPWEYDADRRGGVYGRKGYYKDGAAEFAKVYFSYWGL